MSAALVVFTAGRRTYLERTLASLAEQVDHEFAYRAIIDDSGDAEFGAWLDDTLDGWTMIHHETNRGLPAAIGSAWTWLIGTDAHWVFHLEEDWTFPQPVDVARMIERCEASDLDQLVLYRQPWSPAEVVGGGYLHSAGCYERVEDDLWLTSEMFSFNPCVYPSDVCLLPGGFEADVTARFDGEGRFGVLTGADESPLCWHIGVERAL